MLACGAATLNSWQEQGGDRLLRRTRYRPLARGVISSDFALIQAVIFTVSGVGIIYVASRLQAPVYLGIGAVMLYNFIYTPLKYKTVYAMIPGALCGALPPYIGWLAAGGSLYAPVILLVISLQAVWQIPHFWLVVLGNKPDYLASNLPSMIKLVPERVLRALMMVWIGALPVIVHLLLLALDHIACGYRLVMSLSSLMMTFIFFIELWGRANPDYRLLFGVINGFMFAFMCVLAVGAVSAP